MSAAAETGAHLMEEKPFCLQGRLFSVRIERNKRNWDGASMQTGAADSFQGSSPEPGSAWQSTPSMGSFYPPGASCCFVLVSPDSHLAHPPQSTSSSPCSAPTPCCSRKCYCTGDISLRRLTFPFGRSYSLYSPFYLLLLWLVDHYRGYFNIAVIKNLWW